MKKRMTKIMTAFLAVAVASTSMIIAGCRNTEIDSTSVESEVTSVSEVEIEIADAESADLTIIVNADEGWSEDSTPAIAHIEGEDVDFYHAIYASEEGNTGTSTVTVPVGEYTVSFISPVNSDGSAYTIYDTGEAIQIAVTAVAETDTEDTEAEADSEVEAEVETEVGVEAEAEIDVYNVETASASAESSETIETETNTVICEMKKIPAEKVTDEMLQEIVEQVKEAIANGDETLTGDNESEILEKLEKNVAANPNVAEETAANEEGAESDDSLTDTSTSDSASGSSSTGSSGSTGSSNSGSSDSASSGTSGSGGTTSSGSSSSGSSSSTTTCTHSWLIHWETREIWVEPEYYYMEVPTYNTHNVFSDGTVFCSGDYSTYDEWYDATAAYALSIGTTTIVNGLSVTVSANWGSYQVRDGKETETILSYYIEGYYTNDVYMDYQYCKYCGAIK